MKKILLIAAVAGFVMTSCKKDFTCTCKDNDTANPGQDIVITGSAKKKDAEKTCDAAKTTYAAVDYSCKLSY